MKININYTGVVFPRRGLIWSFNCKLYYFGFYCISSFDGIEMSAFFKQLKIFNEK